MNSTFSKNLFNLRKSFNLKQDFLAQKIGISRSVLSYYESGKSEPTLSILIKLSDFFNISIDKLISDDLFDTKSSDFNIDLFSIDNLKIDLEYKKQCYIEEKEILNRICTIDIPRKIEEIDRLLSYLNKDKVINFKEVNKSNEEYTDELVPNIIDLNSSKKEQIYREIKDFGPIPAGKISLTYEDNMEFVSIPEDNLNSSKGYYVLHISGDSMNKLYKDGEIILVENTSCVAPGDIVIARVGSYATIKRLEIDDEYITLIPESTNPKHKIQTFRHKDICIQGKVIGRLSDYL
ncbi:MAG: helix-turn-helix domain-containing protein [Tenericutes bacterium]|nr:helix-turn-helix domain-containing protein [Mycoplasmatota bacterium]